MSLNNDDERKHSWRRSKPGAWWVRRLALCQVWHRACSIAVYMTIKGLHRPPFCQISFGKVIPQWDAKPDKSLSNSWRPSIARDGQRVKVPFRKALPAGHKHRQLAVSHAPEWLCASWLGLIKGLMYCEGKSFLWWMCWRSIEQTMDVARPIKWEPKN